MPEGFQWSQSLGAWVKIGTPPPPWPHAPAEGFDPAVYGPPGTQWWVNEDRWHDLYENSADSLFRTLLRKLRPFRGPQGAGYRVWTASDPLSPPIEERHEMLYARISVVGTIGLDESVTHTLGLRSAPTVDLAHDPASIQTLANQVRDIWQAWFNSTMPNSAGAVKNQFPGSLVYREVRAAYISVPGPGERVVTPIPGRKDEISFIYPRPTYVVPTQYAAFPANVAGGGSQALPYEVACAMSLVSPARGAANRGRVFLGPFATSILGNDGNFSGNIVNGLSSTFATGVVAAINAQTAFDVHVVSRRWNNSIPVTGVRAGLVPDSQRRRRRSRPESYNNPTPTPLNAP